MAKNRDIKRAQDLHDDRQQGRDVGVPDLPKDPVRHAAGRQSLQAFLEAYFPARFPLLWSPDHLKIIALIERTVREGGLFALAMPRGSGKSTISECAALWATLYGYHAFVTLIGATGEAATEMLTSIKTELVTNDILFDDFREVCGAVRELEETANRAKGQHQEGVKTRIKWGKNMVVYPCRRWKDGTPTVNSEAVITVAAILGRVRGMKYARANGTIIRPTFVIPDDPQTDDAANSPLQCKRRHGVLNGAVLKLAGPSQKIAAICPCTVIRKGDLADRLLDRELSPQWHGQRCKRLYKFPDKMDLWKQYAVLRADDLRADGSGQPAKDFLAANFEAMHAGSEVAWPQRFEPGDLSALETVMIRFFEDPTSFWAEDQNEPQDEELSDGDLKKADLVTRFSGRPRGQVPGWADTLTAFIDVQQTLLYWAVCAWKSSAFTGSVIAYGSWPGQNRNYFTLKDAQHTIQDALPGHALEAQIRKALDDLEAYLLDRDWPREDGTAMRIGKLLKDAGYEMKTIFEQSRASRFRTISQPSRGVPIGPGETPMMEYQAKPGEVKHDHVIITTPRGFAVSWAKMDANYWKSFIAARLRQQLGSPGALTFHGESRKDADHEMLADHLCAERATLAQQKGRKVMVWEMLPGTENHWFDCLYGCAAAAATLGVSLDGQSKVKRPNPSQRPTLGAMKNGRRA